MNLDVLETDKRTSDRPENLYRFDRRLDEASLDLSPVSVATLQVNVGKLCNQACLHCHVDAGPKRTEMIDRATADQILRVLEAEPAITTLDITGGAPELSDQFEHLALGARRIGRHVMVRHNLTVQFDPHPLDGRSMAHLPEFFAEHELEVVCSLPYYAEYFTDKQRGRGVFAKSIDGLRRLNDLGYGTERLQLNLVYNPAGAFLPAAQESLEADYRRELGERFGIRFNNLYAIANLPIHRFKHDLIRRGGYEEYMQKLLDAFNPAAAEGVMCRTMVSVNYDGRLSDCDFNQMFEIGLDKRSSRTIFDWDTEAIIERRIRFADHCYGCTAGAGSSCGGATV